MSENQNESLIRQLGDNPMAETVWTGLPVGRFIFHANRFVFAIVPLTVTEADGRMNGRMAGWADGWTDRWMQLDGVSCRVRPFAPIVQDLHAGFSLS